MLLILIYLLCACGSRAVANTCSSRDIPVPFPETLGKVLSGHSYNSLQHLSLVQCAIRCMRQKKCVSFNFHRHNSTCEFNKETHLTYPGSLVPASSADEEYFAEYQWDQTWLGDCRYHDCPVDSECLGITKTKPVSYICTSGLRPLTITTLPVITASMPVMPATSGSATASGTSDTTTTSGTPDSTTTSKTPDTPTKPGLPDTTTKPGLPGTTTKPELPGTTTTSGTSVTTTGVAECDVASDCAGCVSGGVVDGKSYSPHGCFMSSVPFTGVMVLTNVISSIIYDYGANNKTLYEEVVRECAAATTAYDYFGLGDVWFCVAGNTLTTTESDMASYTQSQCERYCVQNGVGIGITPLTFVYKWRK